MKDLTLLSPKTGAQLQWVPPANYSFVASYPLLPAQAGEAGKMASTLPLALVKDSTQPSGWELVVVCGSTKASNAMVSTEGRWLASAAPECIGYLPFGLKEIGSGKALAALDPRYAEGIVGKSVQGVPLYGEDGKLHPVAQKRLAFLSERQLKIRRTQDILTSLDKAGLFAPWPESVIKAGGITIAGLYTIDEKALHALDDETFLSLRKSGALAVAYSCLLSLYQVRNLSSQAGGDKVASQSAVQTTGDLDLEFLNDSETIKFGPAH